MDATVKGEFRELNESETCLASGGWLDSFDFGTFYSPITVYGSPFSNPSVGFSGLSFGLGVGIGGLGGFFPSLAGLDLSGLSYLPTDNSANATPAPNQHVAPKGYHFVDMDPSGEHYMVKDGDPNNALQITPWYQQKIDSQHTNWDGVAKDLLNIGVGSATAAGPGWLSVIGLGLSVFNFAFPK